MLKGTVRKKIGEGMQSSSKQNKNKKLLDILEVTSFITNLSTSLCVAKAGNLKLDFMAKSIGIEFFGFENILDVIEIPKP